MGQRTRRASRKGRLWRARHRHLLKSRATIQAKTRIAATYGGIMAWEGAQDASGEDSLLSAIREAAE